MDALIVGRSPDADLRIPDRTRSVGRQHARLWVHPGGTCELEDLTSTNGTYINGIRLQPNLRYPLRSGDLVKLGKVTFHGWKNYVGPQAAAGPNKTDRSADAERPPAASGARRTADRSQPTPPPAAVPPPATPRSSAPPPEWHAPKSPRRNVPEPQASRPLSNWSMGEAYFDEVSPVKFVGNFRLFLKLQRRPTERILNIVNRKVEKAQSPFAYLGFGLLAYLGGAALAKGAISAGDDGTQAFGVAIDGLVEVPVIYTVYLAVVVLATAWGLHLILRNRSERRRHFRHFLEAASLYHGSVYVYFGLFMVCMAAIIRIAEAQNDAAMIVALLFMLGAMIVIGYILFHFVSFCKVIKRFYRISMGRTVFSLFLVGFVISLIGGLMITLLETLMPT